jgi:HEAT repeat protein
MLLSRLSMVLVLVATAVVSADEPAAPKPEASEDPQELIRQLDADDFNDRQAASEALAKRGKQAVPALEEAVRGESLEASTRSFELLRRMFEKGDA